MFENYQHIAIEGNIGAGKTTAAGLLANHANARLLLESFENNPFLPMFYANRKRYAFQVEMFFLAERYHQLSVGASPDLFQNTLICDYFFTKSAIFARANLQGAELELFMRLFQIMKKSIPGPDIIIYLHMPVENILERISSRGRPYEKMIPHDYLKTIEELYFEALKEIKDIPVVVIDQMKAKVTDRESILNILLDVLSKPARPGLGYY
ncbi:MAG: deoxyguanosine kinase [Salibacteraceae bacterium]